MMIALSWLDRDGHHGGTVVGDHRSIAYLIRWMERSRDFASLRAVDCKSGLMLDPAKGLNEYVEDEGMPGVVMRGGEDWAELDRIGRRAYHDAVKAAVESGETVRQSRLE
jgi:hypothetical protein